MNLGDVVKYLFSRKYPIIGMIVKKWDWSFAEQVISSGTYLYSVEILEFTGDISVFDIHEGDEFEVLNELC